MMNVGNPDEAFRLSLLPNDGVGLARIEFIIATAIRVHPMALLHSERARRPGDASGDRPRCTARLRRQAREFFVDRLAEGVAMIAAAFYPEGRHRPALATSRRTSTPSLIGGAALRAVEENPMLGFRGASRYYDPRYREGFALECRAMRHVREDDGARRTSS